jgi:hypothetical protein
MICPIDDQPCTGDHSVRCAQECERVRNLPSISLVESLEEKPGMYESHTKAIIGIAVTCGISIIFLAICIAIAVIILNVGRGIG